jgi:hypothetical protein
MSESAGKDRVRPAIAMGIVCMFLCAGGRLAQTVYTLHIESQPLDAALQEFARQTGMQILFFSDLTHGSRSGELNGKYTLDTAMTALLSGSKLTYRRINAKTIEIVPMRAGRAVRNTERRLR